MIARLWRGRAADAAKADAYVRHFTGTVSAELKGLAGHRGAWLLRREVDGGTEFIALTLWESRQSIEAFTGPDISKSVVEPEARAVLDRVRRLRKPLRRRLHRPAPDLQDLPDLDGHIQEDKELDVGEQVRLAASRGCPRGIRGRPAILRRRSRHDFHRRRRYRHPLRRPGCRMPPPPCSSSSPASPNRRSLPPRPPSDPIDVAEQPVVALAAEQAVVAAGGRGRSARI